MSLGRPVEQVATVTRERREIISAIAVIVLIPTVIILGAWLVIVSQRDFARSSMSKLAATSSETSARVIQPQLSKPKAVVRSAKQLAGDDVVRVMVLRPVEGKTALTVAASTDPSFEDDLPKESIYRMAEQEGRTVTRELTNLPGTGQLWQGVTPMIDDGEVLGFVNTTVAVNDLVERSDDFTAQVTLLTTGLVVAVIFLLAAHFRLLDYAELMQQKAHNEALRRDLLKIVGSDVHEAVTALKRDLGRLEKTKSPEARRQAIADLRDKTANLTDDLSLWKAVREVEGGDVTYRLRHVALSKFLQDVAKSHKKVKLELPPNDQRINVDRTHLASALDLLIEAIEDDNPQTIELGFKSFPRSVEIIIERLRDDHPGDPRIMIARYHVEGMGGSLRRARHGDVIISFPIA